MKLLSFVSFDGIPFGAPLAAVEARGAPNRRRHNRRSGAEELWFDRVIFRFDEHGFSEASFRPPSEMEINGECVSQDALLTFMKNSAGYYEQAGFAIAPALGLMFDLDELKWATAYKRGHLDRLMKPPNQAPGPTPTTGMSASEPPPRRP